MIPFITITVSFCLLFGGCGQESREAISEYAGDGEIKHLRAPGVLGIDGIVIKLPDFDLSQNHRTQYSLKGLPEGVPYMMFFVVPEPAPIAKIEKNSIRIKIIKNGKIFRGIDMPIGNMISSQEKGLNRYYCLEGHRNHRFSTQIDMNDNANYAIELSYDNRNLDKVAKGYLLLERGAFK